MDPCQTILAKQNVGLKTEGMKDEESDDTHLTSGATEGWSMDGYFLEELARGWL